MSDYLESTIEFGCGCCSNCECSEESICGCGCDCLYSNE